jgi:hypothetical protein
MEKNSQLFEALVKLIQESFRDRPATEILQRHSLVNKGDRKRNFDVVVKTEANNQPILIVIECKDHGKKVEAKEIEAFNSKCERIEGLNVKKFVSSKGYQADAVNAARDFNIRLHQLGELDSSIIQDWIQKFELRKTMTNGLITSVAIKFRNPAERFPFSPDLPIYDEGTTSPIPLMELVLKFYESQKMAINNLAIDLYNKRSLESGHVIEFEVEPIFDNRLFVLKGAERCDVDLIKVTFRFKIIEQLLVPDYTKSFIQNSSMENKAELMSFKDSDGFNRITVIRNPSDRSHVHVMVTNNDGGPLNSDKVPGFLIPKGTKVEIR